MFLRLLIISLLFIGSVSAQTVAFDMDETLIQSDKLLDKKVKLAKELGFQVNTSINGQEYIIRPGVIELLEYAKEQGFDLIIISHNRKKYLNDILQSSGLFKYFDRVISQETLRESINRDKETYPNHRNFTYEKQSMIRAYRKHFFSGYLVRGWQRLTGNKNIHPFFPHVYNAKYPPMYGTRILIDNAKFNVENPVDFVGIKVANFYADQKEDLSKDWIESIKADLDYLKANDWTKLYQLKYDKAPIVDDVKLVD